MSKLPQSFIASLNDVAKANFFEARQRYLLHLGESLIMHICSFVLAEYKETGTHFMNLEKEIINNKKSLSVGTYVGWIRNTSQYLSEINKPSLLDGLIRNEEKNDVLANYIACFDILKKVVESDEKENLYERCIQLKKGTTLKKCNLNQFLNKFVELRNKIAHPIYYVKGKTITWPFTDDSYRFILEPLELAIQGVLDQLNPIWEYERYIVLENDNNSLKLDLEDGNETKIINSGIQLPEGVFVLLNAKQHLLPSDWKILLQPDPMVVEKIKAEHDELRKMSSLSELKEQILVALDDGQISVEEFRFLESVSRNKLGLNSEQLKELIIKTAYEIDIENPFPEVNLRFIEDIDNAIRNRSVNELVLKLIGEQYGVLPSDFDKVFDSRAYALGVDPAEARKSNSVTFKKEELQIFNSLIMARTWLMSMLKLNNGGGESNYTILGDVNTPESIEYWHKTAFSSLERFVQSKLKVLQESGGLEWEATQNKWQIGKMTGYAWCSIKPKDAITGGALALHYSLYGDGSFAVGFMTDKKDLKRIKHLGLLVAVSGKSFLTFFTEYKEELKKYKNLMLFHGESKLTWGYAPIMDIVEKYPWVFLLDYKLENYIQFKYKMLQTISNPELTIESFDVAFNLFNVLIPKIIQDYETVIFDMIDPLLEPEETIRKCLQSIEEQTANNYLISSKINKLFTGSPEEGKISYIIQNTVENLLISISYDFVADYFTNEIYFNLKISSGGRIGKVHSAIDDVLVNFYFDADGFERYYRPGYIIFRNKVDVNVMEESIVSSAADFTKSFALFAAKNNLDILGLIPTVPVFNEYNESLNSVLDTILNSQKDTFNNPIKPERSLLKGLYYLDCVFTSNKKYGFHWIGWGVNATNPDNLTLGIFVFLSSLSKGLNLSNDLMEFAKENSDWSLKENGTKPEISEAKWGHLELDDESYSSSSEWNRNHAAKFAKLNSEPKVANWSSKKCDTNQWLQIDLGETKTIWGVASQGLYNKDRWVISYNLSISNDGKNWTIIENEISGNFDKETVVEFILASPVIARYVRFIPTSWNEWISMRADVLYSDAPDISISLTKWQDLNNETLSIFPKWLELEIEKIKNKTAYAFSFKTS